MRAVGLVPARSGSKGLPDKNITPVKGAPLLAHSIRFARELGLDDVVCSTDSLTYAEIAQEHGALIPRLRSAEAARDSSMEPEVIDDLHEMVGEGLLERPGVIVWLRPTFVFRSLTATQKCLDDVLSGAASSSRVVTEADPRLYVEREGFLVPSFDDGGASMVRRQDVGAAYKVFNVEVFRMPNKPCPIDYLGERVTFHVAPKLCGLDIDDSQDLAIVEAALAVTGTATLD